MAVAGVTTNFALQKPVFRGSFWHEAMWENFDRLDALIYGLAGDVSFELSNWANSTAYLIGDRVVDTVDATIWQAVVAHTSGASPQTMAQYRAANPTHWISFGASWAARGAWAQNTFYVRNDMVYDANEHVYAICITDHTSTAVGTIRTDAVNWVFIADIDPSLDAAAASAAAAAASAVDAAATSTLARGPGFKNILINPYGQISQRGAQPLAPTDDTYSHDRWYALTQTGSILTNTSLDPLDGCPSAWQLYQNQAVAQRMGYAQIIEGKNCKHLRGKEVTLSGILQASLPATIRYAILEWTGTVDAVVSDIVNTWTSGTYTINNFFINNANLTVRAVGSFAATGVYTDFTPLVATLGNTFNNLIIFFWTEAAAAQNSFFHGAVQLEEGAIATPREHRPYSVETEMCQRYYQQFGGATNTITMGGYGAAATPIYLPISFLTEMRVAPTGAKAGTWGVSNCAQPALSISNPRTFIISTTVTALGNYTVNPDSADDLLTFSAEL